MKKTLLSVALAAGLFSGVAQADTLEWEGKFENTNSYFTSDYFVVNADGAASGVTVFTDSFAAGNFDPVLFVWDADGVLAGFDNNITSSNRDAFVSFTGLVEGASYSFTILNAPSTIANAFPPVVGQTKLSDGFMFATAPGVLPGGYGSDWHVTATGVSVTAVPEPETWAMLLAGLGVMGAVARRRQK